MKLSKGLADFIGGICVLSYLVSIIFIMITVILYVLHLRFERALDIGAGAGIVYWFCYGLSFIKAEEE